MEFPFKNNFKFVKREINTGRIINNEYHEEKRYIIGCEIEGIIIPHPITDFIDKKFHLKSGSINSERSAADILVQFLNYVLLQKLDGHPDFCEVKGIRDLELHHLEKFLAYCGEKGNLRQTVKRKEYYLLKFFHFIGIEKKILNIRPAINVNSNQNFKDKNRWNNSTTLNSVLYYKLPSKSTSPLMIKKKDFVTQKWNTKQDRKAIRIQIIREILILASNSFPDIALAVCLQTFGGLRSAECMNLQISSVKPQKNSKYGSRGIVVEIRDRQHNLFDANTSLNNDQVKKERDQAILIDPIVPYIYKKHLDWLLLKKSELKNNKQEIANELALFLNSKGQPMKTHSYRFRFNSLKKLYLNLLANTEGRYEDFKEFRNTSWSTHICRGAFTNLCLDSGFTATQTAVMRGDSSPDAMNAYIDILSASYKISQSFNSLLNEETIEKNFKENNLEVTKTWKEIREFNEKYN